MASQMPDYASSAVIAEAQALLGQGDVTGAWDVLADHGDGYADNAAAVTGGADNPADKAYQYMVENHWNNTTGGPDAYNNLFDAVAQQHLQNYLDWLDDGIFPSSNQIVDSYIQSLENLICLPKSHLMLHGKQRWAIQNGRKCLEWTQVE